MSSMALLAPLLATPVQSLIYIILIDYTQRYCEHNSHVMHYVIAEKIAQLFPNVFGQSSAKLVPGSGSAVENKSLKIGVVLSGGQAPGGHNVISGIFGRLLVF